MAVSLTKGSAISLTKKDGNALEQVFLGLGWDEVKKKRGFFGAFSGGGGEIDLDASAILFNQAGEPVDYVWYSQLTSRDGAIRHTGDNLTGAGDGDDEQILVDLRRIPASVEAIVFVITSYSGQKFSSIENVFTRVVDTSQSKSEEIVRFEPSTGDASNNTAMVMAKIFRDGSGWKFGAVGVPTDGKHVKSAAVISAARAAL